VIALWTAHSSVSPWVVAEAEHGHALMKLVNLCGPEFNVENIPKPFSIYNSLLWAQLQDLPAVLAQGYFGLHAQPDELRVSDNRIAANIPFLEILDELYFHHVSEARPSAEGLKKYLRRFPNGIHEAHAARQLAELTETPGGKLSVTATEIPSDQSQRIVKLLRGVRHDGLPFWAYVAVLPSRYADFDSTRRAGKLDLLNFLSWGDVVSAGVAHWPSHADHLYIADRFGLDPKELFSQAAEGQIRNLVDPRPSAPT
jgi:hypothetical protein